MLGPLTICRHGVPMALPASRKVRGLLAYLALAPHAVARSQLCELLWDVPNDPRGEFRWCLSKIRGLVDRARAAQGSTPAGIPSGSTWRTASSMRSRSPRAGREGIETVAAGAAAALAGGLRRRVAGRPGDRAQPGLRGLGHRRSGADSVAITRRCWNGWSSSVPDDEAGRLSRAVAACWPRSTSAFTRLLLNALAQRGQIREGEAHLAATIRLFEAEGLDCGANSRSVAVGQGPS